MSKQGLKSIAYDYLRDAITTFKLKPGQPLIEQELSERLGISRTPVREALKQLENDGLVKHFPSRGSFVAPLTLQDAEEIFQLRILFEKTSLESAIYSIPEDLLDQMIHDMQVIDATQFDTSAGREAFYQSDRELHEMIMRYSGNSYLFHFYKLLQIKFEQLRRLAFTSPVRLAKSNQEHILLLTELKKRDVDAAEECLLNHLDHIKRSAINACRAMNAQY